MTETEYGTTYFSDGTIEVWDVYRQGWIKARPRDLSDRIWASVTPEERSRWRSHKGFREGVDAQERERIREEKQLADLDRAVQGEGSSLRAMLAIHQSRKSKSKK